MSSLFLDHEYKLEFSKMAMPVMLSDAPEAWQREVASEIFKQVPYIGDYSVNVVIERVNPERGYGFGSAEVRPRSEAPEQEQEALPKVTIPLIIKDRMLQPLDVFMDGEDVYPLSEERLHEHLFRTATFETSARKPQDRGMADQLYPPMRTNYGNNMQSLGEGVMGKFAADKFAGELVEMAESLEKNPKVQGAQSLIHRIFGRDKEKTANLKNLGEYAHKSKGKKEHKDDSQVKRETTPDSRNRPVQGIFGVKEAEGDPMAYHRRLVREGSAQPGQLGKDACMPVKQASLLEAIAHTVPLTEVDNFISKVTGDLTIKTAAIRNETFKTLALTVAGFQSAGVEKTAKALVNSIKPNVVQLTKMASGEWLLKHANTDAFNPQAQNISGDDASQMMGTDKAEGAQPGSTVTLSTNKVQQQSLTEGDVVLVDRFGKYTVWTAENQPLEGWIIPVMSYEMEELPLYIFVSPETGHWAVQGDIAGMANPNGNAAEELQPMLTQQPQGEGAFIAIAQDGMKALLPAIIQNSAQGPDGSVEHHGHDFFEEPIVLKNAPGLQNVETLEEGTYAIPDSMMWLPFAGEAISLVENPLDVHQLEQAQQNPGAVSVGSTGKGEFSLEGAPVEKLAFEQTQFLKKADAEFLLVGMGLDPFQAREVLTRAERGEKVKLAGMRTITPLSHLHSEMLKKASVFLTEFPYYLRRDLIKEAAALEDSETADKILALNFINPENISTFASYLPELDKTASKLAEMLVASRLGMNQIPEGAVERSMHNLEDVIEGLKGLHQKNLV